GTDALPLLLALRQVLLEDLADGQAGPLGDLLVQPPHHGEGAVQLDPVRLGADPSAEQVTQCHEYLHTSCAGPDGPAVRKERGEQHLDRAGGVSRGIGVRDPPRRAGSPCVRDSPASPWWPGWWSAGGPPRP